VAKGRVVAEAAATGHAGMYGVLSASLGGKNFLGASPFSKSRRRHQDVFPCRMSTIMPHHKGLGQKWEMMDTSIKFMRAAGFQRHR